MSGLATGEVNYRRQWEDFEATEGVYDFSGMVNLFTKARANNQSVNFRAIEFEPDSGFDCPTWVANQDGYYTVSYDDVAAGLPNSKVCNWANSNTRTRVATMLTDLASYTNGSTFQTAFKNHPAWGAIDIPIWGQSGEANWSGWTYVSKTTGSVANCSPNPTPCSSPAASDPNNQAIPPADSGAINKPSDTAQNDLVDKYLAAFDNNYFVNTIGLQDNGGQQYAMLTKLTGWRGDCFGFKKTPAACPETGGNQMCGLYPHELGYAANTLSGAGALPLSLNGAAILEICNTLSTWNSTGAASPYDIYDSAQSLTWLGQVGASAINVKNNFSAYAAYTNAFATERTMGYRFYLASMSHLRAVTGGSNLSVTTNWYNRGVAKFYAPNYYLMFKLVNQSDSAEVAKFISANQPNTILPTSNPKTFTENLAVPTHLTTGDYDLYVGIGYNNPTARPQDLRRPVIALANNGQASDGQLWYKSNDVVTVTNAVPTANPTINYAASFASASSQGLTLNDSSTALDPIATDIELAVWVNTTTKGAIRPIFNKGPADGINQSFALELNNAVDRYRFTVSNGVGIFALDDNTYGSPVTAHWDCLLARLDNTAKSMSLRTNLGSAVTRSMTGSIIDNTRAIRLGTDSSSHYHNGAIFKPMYWKRLLTTAEENLYCQTHGLALEDMPFTMTDKLYFAPTLNEATGDRSDGFQHWLMTDSGGVTRTTAP